MLNRVLSPKRYFLYLKKPIQYINEKSTSFIWDKSILDEVKTFKIQYCRKNYHIKCYKHTDNEVSFNFYSEIHSDMH